MLKFCLIIGLSTYLVGGIPRPQGEEYEYEYEEEDVCLTSADSDDPEKECIFPFTYNNFTYNGCPTDPVDKTKRWCSTKTDKNGVHITGNGAWGYCTTGCKPEIFPDELLIGSDANDDMQTDTCDYTACNGFTLKLDVFDKVETYGQCQYPAGNNGAEDFFCFVNADAACEDKVPYGDEEEGLLVTTLACKDPNAPLPRSGFFRMSSGFLGSYSYGWGRYNKGGYRGSSYHRGSSYGGSSHHHGSSYGSSSYRPSYGGSSHHHGSSYGSSSYRPSYGSSSYRPSYGGSSHKHGSSYGGSSHKHGSSYGGSSHKHGSSYGGSSHKHGSSYKPRRRYGSSHKSHQSSGGHVDLGSFPR